MKRLKIIGARLTLSVLLAFGFQGIAWAHVLVVDHQSNIAAVLHSNPDDDPVAGQTSQLFFDVQDAKSNAHIPYAAYQLVVGDESGNKIFVVTHAYGSTVSAEYTFPSQGLYQLSLRSNPAYYGLQKVSLDTSLRVSRGAGARLDRPRHDWATDSLIVAAVLMVLLLITGFNNRREIFVRGKL
jgi:hypothetical protein